MKYLQIVQSDSEATFKSYNVAYLSEESKNVFVKKYYENPSIVITNDDEYDDKALISLKAKRLGVDGSIVWSHNLGSDIATLDGTTLRFLKHYEGSVKIKATIGEISDEKTIAIKCTAVPDQVTYTVVTPPSVKTVNWDDTTAELSFVGKIVASYSDGHKPSETTQSTYNFTAEFPQNPAPAGSYPTVNKEYVDLGLPSGTMWAKCNLFAQNETDYGWYFQWGDTNGYPKVDKSTIDRTGKYDWEGHNVDWTVKQKNQLSKIFDYSTTPYQTNASAGTDSLNTKFTKYLGSTSSSYKDPSATDEDALKKGLDPMDDAVVRLMGEGWSMPTYGQWEELVNGTTNTWVRLNGVNGYKFVSKTDSSKYIFIPAAGFANGDGVSDIGSHGFVWSRSLKTPTPYMSYCLSFYSEVCSMGDDGRQSGLSVRGVRK